MAYLFVNADTEYLQVDQAPVSDVPFTLACWFYAVNTFDNHTLVGIGDKDVADNYHAIYARGGETGDPVRAFSYDGTLASADTSSGFSSGTWHHACGVFPSSVLRAAFIDGGSKGTDTTDVSPSGLDRTSVGRTPDSTPGNYADARVAELGVWDVALSDAEVAMLPYVSPVMVRPQNLVAYWRLIRGLQDIVGGYDLTAFNSPAVAAHVPIAYPVPVRGYFRGVTAHTLDLDDGAGGADALTWLVGKALTAGADVDEALAWAMGQLLSDGVTGADALTWLMGQARADGATADEALAWAMGRTLGDAAQAGDAAVWALGKARADGAQAGDAAPSWAMGMARADGAEGSDAPSWAMGMARADGADADDALAWAMGMGAFADGAQAGDALAWAMGMARADGADAGDALVWLLGKAMADGATASELISLVLVFGVQLADGADAGDALAWAMGQALSDGALAGDVLAWALALAAFADGVQGGDVLAWALALAAFADGAQVGDVAALEAGKVLGDGSTAGDALAWLFGKVLGDGTTAGDALAWLLAQTLSDGALAGDVLTWAGGWALADGVTGADALAWALALGLGDGATAGDVITLSVLEPVLASVLWADAAGRAVHQVVYLVVGDTLPVLQFRLLGPDDVQLDLAGATVSFQMVDRAGTLVVDGAATVSASGVVEYRLQSGDTATAGEFRAQLVTTLGGRLMVSERFAVRVREGL